MKSVWAFGQKNNPYIVEAQDSERMDAESPGEEGPFFVIRSRRD